MKKILLSILAIVILASGTSCTLVDEKDTSSVRALKTTSITSVKTTIDKSTIITEENTESDEIKWNDAINHIGEYATVVGKVKSVKFASYSSGSPTFINIGEDYPSHDRFSAVIWGENRSNCYSVLEELDYNDKVAISGYIKNYNGVAQIEVSSSSNIEIR